MQPIDFPFYLFFLRRFPSIGSCLSYGHSCWGAHGKRSSNDRIDAEQQPDRWAMFKLIQDEVIAHIPTNNESLIWLR